MTSQVFVPLIELPVIAFAPCRVHTTPNKPISTPTISSAQFFIIGSYALVDNCVIDVGI